MVVFFVKKKTKKIILKNNKSLKNIKIKLTMKNLLKHVFFISLGVLSAGFGLKGFLLPNGFIDGGVTGISLLFEALTNYPLALLIVIINAPFILLGYFQIGKTLYY